jgi:hypothetical protein
LRKANLDRLPTRQVAGIFMADTSKATSVTIYSVPPAEWASKASSPSIVAERIAAADADTWSR